LREKVGLGRSGRFDPFAVDVALGIVIANPQDLTQLTTADQTSLQHVDARTWSGGATRLPDGRLLVLLNPNQTLEWARVTLMEEVAHAHFGHKPTSLATDPFGLSGRRYDSKAEDEAYWTASATLLPSRVVARAVWDGVPEEVLAADYGVSIELVKFRIKTLRLWPYHRPHRAAA
jgi:Zn-dependent peptidase ImmA (M78 family)